ncbi:MAG TPA: carboxypeptidase-like regulatory domain-containing protein, partial [Bacteroidia bacterium]|nr:carboxypeptidase-like regulatory domain-containing protein [Bacteroidia bacterium]
MRVFVSLLMIFLCGSVFSQQYTIKGKIFNAQSKEPIPFASVILKGTTVGTNTDFDGNFILTTDKISDSLIAIYIGYQRIAAPLKKSISQTINIPFYALQEGISLNEVVVKAGENPAHRIIRLAIAHKGMNDKARLKSYEYEVYNKIEFDLNNIPKKLKDNKAFKPIKFIFNNMDSANSAEKPSLPLFMVETVSDFYYRSNPKAKKEIIKASKISGIQNQS